MKKVLVLLCLVGVLGANTAHADIITLRWTCDTCEILPLPTVVEFDPDTQLFERFTIRWNAIDFDYTFPNLQPPFVREWFWDALNGRPVGETALPGTPLEVATLYWFADIYSPETNACFDFRIRFSGADRCVTPPYSQRTVFDVHDTGTVSRVGRVPEPSTAALLALGLIGLVASRRLLKGLIRINCRTPSRCY